MAMPEAVRQLVFKIPGKDTPGFARRAKRALELKDLHATNPTPKLIDELVYFLADFVKADSRAEAVELMWDATENQWGEMLDALGGVSHGEIPPESPAPSATT